TIRAYFDTPESAALVDRLIAAGVSPESPKPTPPDRSSTLQGETVLFTGKLLTMSREAAQALVREHGGQVATAWSGNVTILVVGDKPGSKREKAIRAGIRVLEERQFLYSINP
ncbi:NAD-dependent DNA ligase LigA, partial [bacterium]|nr:NAD-dependent DNA ligase LigA [candidate division CSSED10-310 bacterium]